MLSEPQIMELFKQLYAIDNFAPSLINSELDPDEIMRRVLSAQNRAEEYFQQWEKEQNETRKENTDSHCDS